jgi:hypothetical protein
VRRICFHEHFPKLCAHHYEECPSRPCVSSFLLSILGEKKHNITQIRCIISLSNCNLCCRFTQCASVLLTTYIPVYIYIYGFQIFATAVFLLLATYSNSPRFPRWMRGHFPAIKPVVERFVESPDKLINLRNLVTSCGHHLAVTLTFGLCSPYLAAAIATTVLSNVLLWKYLVGRCAWYHVNVWSVEESCAQDSGPFDSTDSVYKADEDNKEKAKEVEHPIEKYTMRVLDAAVCDVSIMFMHMLWPVVFLSGVFMGMLCWDMAGDRTGWRDSMWIPLTSACIPATLWTTVSVVKKRCACGIQASSMENIVALDIVGAVVEIVSTRGSDKEDPTKEGLELKKSYVGIHNPLSPQSNEVP